MDSSQSNYRYRSESVFNRFNQNDFIEQCEDDKDDLLRRNIHGQFQLRAPIVTQNANYLSPDQLAVQKNLELTREKILEVINLLPKDCMDSSLQSNKLKLKESITELLTILYDLFLDLGIFFGSEKELVERWTLRKVKKIFAQYLGIDFLHSIDQWDLEKNAIGLSIIEVKSVSNSSDSSLAHLLLFREKITLMADYFKNRSKGNDKKFTEHGKILEIISKIENVIQKNTKKMVNDHTIKKNTEALDTKSLILDSYANTSQLLNGFIIGVLNLKIDAIQSNWQRERVPSIEQSNTTPIPSSPFTTNINLNLKSTHEQLKDLEKNLPKTLDQILTDDNVQTLQQNGIQFLLALFKTCIGLNIPFGTIEQLTIRWVARKIKLFLQDSLKTKFYDHSHPWDLENHPNVLATLGIKVHTKDLETPKKVIELFYQAREKLKVIVHVFEEHALGNSERKLLATSDINYFTDNCHLFLSKEAKKNLLEIDQKISKAFEKLSQDASFIQQKSLNKEESIQKIYRSLAKFIGHGFINIALKNKILSLLTSFFNQTENQDFTYKNSITRLTEQFWKYKISSFYSELDRAICGEIMTFYLYNKKEPWLESFKANTVETIDQKQERIDDYLKSWFKFYSLNFYKNENYYADLHQILDETLDAKKIKDPISRHQIYYDFIDLFRSNPTDSSVQKKIEEITTKFVKIHSNLPGISHQFTAKQFIEKMLYYNYLGYLLCYQKVSTFGLIALRDAYATINNQGLTSSNINMKDNQDKNIEIRACEDSLVVKYTFIRSITQFPEICKLIQHIQIKIPYPNQTSELPFIEAEINFYFHQKKEGKPYSKQVLESMTNELARINSFIKGLGYPHPKKAIF